MLYGTTKFSIIIVEPLNSTYNLHLLAATNMFERGWNLMKLIDKRPRDPKQFHPARLKPIPIFYGTPNFPIIIVQTLNSCPFWTSMAATNMFEPGWILINFIDKQTVDPNQIDPARLRPIFIFYGTPNFPIIIVQTLNSSPLWTSKAATNMFEPGWILIGFIEDQLGEPKQFDPAGLKPSPIFYRDAKLPYNSSIRH